MVNIEGTLYRVKMKQFKDRETGEVSDPRWEIGITDGVDENVITLNDKPKCELGAKVRASCRVAAAKTQRGELTGQVAFYCDDFLVLPPPPAPYIHKEALPLNDAPSSGARPLANGNANAVAAVAR